MAIIQKRMLLRGSKGQEDVVALFDTGSTYSCIRPELADKLGMIERLPEPIELATAKEGEKLIAEKRITLDFHLDGYRFSDEFILVRSLSEPVIIGAKTMQAWRFKLDLEKEEVLIDPRVTKLRLLPIGIQLGDKMRDLKMGESKVREINCQRGAGTLKLINFPNSSGYGWLVLGCQASGK